MSSYEKTLCLFFIVFLFSASSCDQTSGINSDKKKIDIGNGQVFVKADDSGLKTSERKDLRTIAEKLAVRYVNDRNPEQTQIPQKVIDYFYNGLVYLENSDLPEAKTVTDEYVMGAKDPTDPREVLLWAKDSESWVDHWRNGDTKTGIEAIDKLIDKFNLQLAEYHEYGNTSLQVMAQMKAERPINVYAVGKAFSDLDEIQKAGPDALITGGRDVQAKVTDDYLVLDVTVGSGDCPSGCINKVSHQFHIYSDGKVQVVE